MIPSTARFGRRWAVGITSLIFHCALECVLLRHCGQRCACSGWAGSPGGGHPGRPCATVWASPRRDSHSDDDPRRCRITHQSLCHSESTVIAIAAFGSMETAAHLTPTHLGRERAGCSRGFHTRSCRCRVFLSHLHLPIRQVGQTSIERALR